MAVDIRDLLPQPIAVSLGEGKEIKARGLGVAPISRLLSVHMDSFVAFLGSGGKDYEAMILTAPELAVDIICEACDIDATDPAQREAIKERVPAGTQAELLEAIYTLSVPNEKKLYQLFERVLNALKARNAARLKAQQTNSVEPLPNGSTNSSEQATPSLT